MPTATTADIRISRVFDAPRERVWKAWTDPLEIKKWWGPKGFTSPSAMLDLRVGGTFLYCMHGPAGSEFDKDLWSTGTFREIVPMERIVATDHFADAHGNIISPKEYGMPGDWPEQGMLVTATFEDAGPGKTKLTLLHEGHPKDIADMAKQGWNESLEKLEAMLRP